MNDHERSHLSLVTESGFWRRKRSLVVMYKIKGKPMIRISVEFSYHELEDFPIQKISERKQVKQQLEDKEKKNGIFEEIIGGKKKYLFPSL